MIAARFVTGLMLACTLGACSSSRQLDTGEGGVQSVQQLPPPNPGGVSAAAAQRAYVIGPLDLINILVVGMPEFSFETQVDSGGRIQLPLVGSVVVAGKTPEETSLEIASALRQSYMKNPVVSVSLKEIKSQVVTVGGSVREPGVYPVVGNLTLSGAVALAKGADEFAKLDDVAVFRTVDGQRFAAIFNIKDIRAGKYADPEIFPDDVVMVGDSQVRRLFRDFVLLAPFAAVFRPFGT